MNRLTVFLSLISCLGLSTCATKNNIEPVSDSFFIRLYDGISKGEQYGEDIIAATDGGLLIAGTSDNKDGSSEMLLIKTDNKGNPLWTFSTANLLGPASFAVAKSVLELPGSYLIGGTVGQDDARRSILIKVNFDGSFADSTTVSTLDGLGTAHFNQLSKITLGLSGILVSGETSRPAGFSVNGTNGFIGLFDLALNSLPSTVGANQYFGVDGGDDIVTGAYEVIDLVNSPANTRFLAFGSSPNGTPSLGNDFYYVSFDSDFTIIQDIGATIINEVGDQTSFYVNRDGDNFWMIGASDSPELQMFLVGWFPSISNNKWIPIPGGEDVSNSADVVGKGIAIQGPDKYVIVGDKIFTAGVHTEINLSRVDNFRDIKSPWPKVFGTGSSTYSSSAVTTLQDGSIIIVGTADLQPIKKIIVIKTGPNGEMSF